jgi:hypothetical protein
MIERVLGKGRGVAGGQEELVPLAKGYVELSEHAHQHLASRLGAAGLYKAQMP